MRAERAAPLALCLALAAGAAAADVGDRLRETGRADLAAIWDAARSIEGRGRGIEREHPLQAAEEYQQAARGFERVAQARPEFAEAWWRGARAYWLAADTLPVEQKSRRLRGFERADDMASRGIESDPRCAECMLWKFGAMGRLRTTGSLWSSISQLDDMAALLDDAIALQPTSADDAENSTLGNLHYSSAIFYRVFPDWFWIGWFLGVRGDKDRALAHIQTALSIHPTRLDYRIELGSQLLCLGSTRSDDAKLREGKRVLEEAILREPETQDDAREIAAAQIMLSKPAKACGYSGDTWVEIDRGEALRAAKAARAAH